MIAPPPRWVSMQVSCGGIKAMMGWHKPEDHRKDVIDEAMHLARSPEAADLPGYLGPG